jgi:hypothetical protein
VVCRTSASARLRRIIAYYDEFFTVFAKVETLTFESSSRCVLSVIVAMAATFVTSTFAGTPLLGRAGHKILASGILVAGGYLPSKLAKFLGLRVKPVLRV